MPSILETVGPRSGSAPLTYTLAEQGTVDVQSIFAHFNGGGAGGTFRPMVTVRSQNGAILARGFPSDSVAAGDSADVTFAPFLRGGGSSTPASGGLNFETYPQSGRWFYAGTTDATGSPNGYGWQVQSADRVGIESTGSHVYITANSGQATLESISGTGSGFCEVESDGTSEVKGANVFSTLLRGEGGEYSVLSGTVSHRIFSVYESGEIEFYMPEAGNYVAFYGASGTALKINRLNEAVFMPSLPILDPGVSGQLWNNAGFVAVSP